MLRRPADGGGPGAAARRRRRSVGTFGGPLFRGPLTISLHILI